MQARHWAQMEEYSFVWGMRFLLSVYFLCGRKVLHVFLYPVVIYYWLINRSARTASLDYLTKLSCVAPELGITGSLLWSYRHFISFANAIVDKLAAWSGALSVRDIAYHGREQLLAAANTGQGALLLGSHLGNLEVCRVIADIDKAVKINVLVHTKHAEKFSRLLNRNSDNRSLNLIQVTDITAATAQLLYDKICAGELIIMAADRTPVGNSRRVSLANFLGAKAEFPQGPFILAALLKCPVYTLFCLKQEGKYHLYFDHFSDCLDIPRQTRNQTIQQFTQHFADRLQAYCLQTPLQWFNFFDFWQLDTDADPH